MTDDLYEYIWETERKGPDSLEGIVSPDLEKMFPLKVNPDTIFYYKTEEKRDLKKARLDKFKNFKRIF